MSFESIQSVDVFYPLQDDMQKVGSLSYRNKRIFFEYDQAFVALNLNLSPFKLPLQTGLVTSDDPTFGGLFGLFNDSLPDGWGHLLLNRKLAKMAINANSLSPLDRLCYVGNDCMGALRYKPSYHPTDTQYTIDLDTIAEEARAVLEDDTDAYVEELLDLSGSSSGARPKIIMEHQGEQWLVKFPASSDPKDIGPIEMAYHLMANEAKVNMADAKLFPSKKGSGFFGTKRFDRLNHNPIHMHSLSGLLHADHRIPCLDYQTILKVTWHLTQSMPACEALFRLCTFNVLSHNRDDHSKNFSYLMNSGGTWHLAPAYDLTFSSGPGGEHCTTIMGHGTHITQEHLLQLATANRIDTNKAHIILEEVREAIAKWPDFAEQTGVSKTSKQNIGRVLQQGLKY